MKRHMCRALLVVACVLMWSPAVAQAITVTVVNQAHVRPSALRLVERAVAAQSLQVRSAWATPAVHFGPGGFKLYLQIGNCGYPHGVHWPTQITVWTGCQTYHGWSQYFSHEIVEWLVDPDGRVGGFVFQPLPSGVWEGVAVEIADPVGPHGYFLKKVGVSDFVLPSWYAGGMLNSACTGDTCDFSNPITTKTTAPYDWLNLVRASWTALPDY